MRLGRAVLVSATIAAAVSVAACGSSASSAKVSPSGSTSAQSAKTAAAEAAIAPYTGHPSAFPVTAPLGKPLPPGTKFVYLQCSTPVCGQIGQLLAPAVKLIGGSYQVINAGGTASTSQAAASSALALKPGAVLLPATEPALFGNGLKKLQAAGVKVVAVGMINPEPYGVTYDLGGLQDVQLAGKLLADWVIVHKGAKANVVFYTTPELSFSPYELQGFEQELKADCSSCSVRSVPVSVTTFGTTAPQTIVNDLQAHPDTNVAVFSTEEMAEGLPAALSSAGVSVTTIGFAPTPENLQDIKAGRLTAGLGLDVPVQEFTQVDAAARLLLGTQPLPAEHLIPLQFLQQQDITFNPANGWTGYPNFAQMFAKLWHPAA